MGINGWLNTVGKVERGGGLEIAVPDDHPLLDTAPTRLPVWWGWRGPVCRTGGGPSHSGRCVVLRIEKRFTRLERFLARLLRAPNVVMRPLDDMNSLVWELSDGAHRFQDIVAAMDATFHEDAAPVIERVTLAIHGFRDLGLMTVNPRPGAPLWSTEPGLVPTGQNIMPRSPDLDVSDGGPRDPQA
jgi:hypothetical protein